jgi:hypothetical protein
MKKNTSGDSALRRPIFSGGDVTQPVVFLERCRIVVARRFNSREQLFRRLRYKCIQSNREYDNRTGTGISSERLFPVFTPPPAPHCDMERIAHR